MDAISETIREQLNAECLRRGWVSQKNPSVGSSTKLAQVLGRTPSFWSDRLTGRRAMSIKLSQEIEDKLDLPRHTLQGNGEEDFVDVPRVDVRVSAGNGSVSEVEEVVGHLKFSRAFLRSCGVNPNSAKVVDVAGHSMDPTIKHGSVLLISTANRDPVDNQFFVLIHHQQGMMVKRLRRLDGRWVARSDNAEYGDIQIGDGDPVSIIGRAIWMGARL